MPIFSIKLNSQEDFNPDTEQDFLITLSDLKLLLFNAGQPLAELADGVLKELIPIAEDKKKLRELKKMSHLYTISGQN